MDGRTFETGFIRSTLKTNKQVMLVLRIDRQDSVTCCHLVNHGDYGNGTDKQTDRCHTITLCFPPDASSVKIKPRFGHIVRLA